MQEIEAGFSLFSSSTYFSSPDFHIESAVAHRKKLAFSYQGRSRAVVCAL
jgi:hypothetical protein